MKTRRRRRRRKKYAQPLVSKIKKEACLSLWACCLVAVDQKKMSEENRMKRESQTSNTRYSLSNDERVTSSCLPILTHMFTCPQIMDVHADRMNLMRNSEDFFRLVSHIYI
jgi:hypothetical protein